MTVPAQTFPFRFDALPQMQITAPTANAFGAGSKACGEAGMDCSLTRPMRKARMLRDNR